MLGEAAGGVALLAIDRLIALAGNAVAVVLVHVGHVDGEGQTVFAARADRLQRLALQNLADPFRAA